MSTSRDQTYLVNEQYKTADNLRARIELHERFSTFKQDFHRWVFDQLDAPETAKVLELGTGPAAFWDKNRERIPESWQVTLTDLSPGMIEEAKQTTKNIDASFDYKVVDAQAIPFDDNSFNLVIANHMLYHVPDLAKAIAEVRRVLKPGGTFAAATNGKAHMLELDQFIIDLVAVHLPDLTLERMSELSFRLDNGADAIRQQFEKLKMIEVPNNALKVTEVEPFMNYIFSMNRLQSQLGTIPEEKVAELAKLARQEVQKKLEQGPIHITKSTGLFIAS